MSEGFGGVEMKLDKEDTATVTLIKVSTFDLYGRNKGMNRGLLLRERTRSNYRNERYTKKTPG